MSVSPRQLVEVAAQAAELALRRAPRVSYLPATLVAFDPATATGAVLLDGDPTEVPCRSIVPNFTPPAGSRVMVALHPPAQTLVVGVIGGGARPRPYRADVWRAAALTIAAGGQFIAYDTKVSDPAGVYSGSTYTCPVDGLYRVSWGTLLNMPAGGTRVLSDLYRNGVSYRRLWDVNPTNASPLEMPATAEVDCKAGDRLQVFVNPPSVAVSINPAGAAYNFATFDLAS